MEVTTSAVPSIVAMTLSSNETTTTICNFAPRETGNYTTETCVDLRNATLFPSGDNSTGNVSNTWSMAFNLVLMVFFMITGFLGNLLIIVVYMRNRRKRQSTANYFLCSLAVVDLIVCMVAIPIQIHLEFSAFNRVIIALECAIFAYIWHVVMFASAWMLVGISIDRYYCLCRPFNRRVQVRQVMRTILLISVFTIVISIPASLFFEDQCRKTQVFTLMARLAMAVADALISVIVPLLIIAVAYAKIFYVISQRSNNTQGESHRQKIMHQTRFVVAKRLLLVIGAFVLCWLPRMVAEIYAATLEPAISVNLTSQALYVCKNIVPYFNSILNPVLYSLINPRFRHECRWILLTCFGRVLPLPAAAAAAKYTCKSSSAL